MIRKSVHTIDEVRAAVIDKMFSKAKREPVEFCGDMIKANSLRYQVFFTKGMTCPICGVQGSFFAKEKHENDKSYHLNLYAVTEDGKEILMTKDHIYPHSKGGSDNLDNLQPMCIVCNMLKGNKIAG